MSPTRTELALFLLALGAGAVFLAVMVYGLFNPAGPGGPLLRAPGEGDEITTLRPVFQWSVPAGATQVEFWMVPEGAAAAIRVTTPERDRFEVPREEQWCCLRAGMGYRWRVRVTDSSIPLGPDDPYWGDWSEERRFTVAPSAR